MVTTEEILNYKLSLIQWIDSTDEREIPNKGKGVIIVAYDYMWSSMHFRIFDTNGNMLVDRPRCEIYSPDEVQNCFHELENELAPLKDNKYPRLEKSQRKAIIQKVVSIIDNDCSSTTYLKTYLLPAIIILVGFFIILGSIGGYNEFKREKYVPLYDVVTIADGKEIDRRPFEESLMLIPIFCILFLLTGVVVILWGFMDMYKTYKYRYRKAWRERPK